MSYIWTSKTLKAMSNQAAGSGTKTRCKFTCQGNTAQGENNGSDILLRAVTSGSEENDSFFHATPYGELNMRVTNETASIFEVGKTYYLDISPAE
jgi:hypothetical protein